MSAAREMNSARFAEAGRVKPTGDPIATFEKNRFGSWPDAIRGPPAIQRGVGGEFSGDGLADPGEPVGDSTAGGATSRTFPTNTMRGAAAMARRTNSRRSIVSTTSGDAR